MPGETYPLRWAGRLAVVSMPAEIDVSNAASVLERLWSILEREPVTVIVDMTLTTFCDSAGVSAIVRACKRAAAQQAEMRLVAPTRAVRRLFTITGLDRMVGVYPSLSASLAAGRPAASTAAPPTAGPGAGETSSRAGTTGPPGPAER
jgi:anti-sigma B factor antagonist